MSQLVRVQNFTVSQDGFGAGQNQSLETPFGVASEVNGTTANLPMDLVSWMFNTAGRPGRNDGQGTRGLDDYFAREFSNNIGAEIMGRNKFAPSRGAWENEDWTGWWGDSPPFHTPVFVMTHHVRPSFTLDDTSFHFVNDTPQEVLRIAKEVANGKDVRIGGGTHTVREFLNAGLIDTLHIAVAPVRIGAGEKFWNSHEDLLDRYECETVVSASNTTHHLFWRR